MRRIAQTIGLFILVLCLGPQSVARAETFRNDINLGKLALHYTDSGNTAIRQVDANSAFRSLMSQLGTVLAPQFLAPAETTGYNGFTIAAKYAATTIDDKAEYWVNGVNRSPDPVMSTLSLEIRKGIWMPLPSFEMGAGFTHLVNSHLFTLNAFFKFALHEGFLHWPTPALAIRFTGQRAMGTSQVDLTILNLDISISKSFGVGGTFNFTPYFGYHVYWVWADSQVIDWSPGTDSLQCSADPTNCSYSNPIPNGQFCTHADCGKNYVFDDQDPILRHRIFLGLRMIFYHFFLTIEGAWSLKGNSRDTMSFGLGEIQDRSKVQQTYSVSVGWDY